MSPQIVPYDPRYRSQVRELAFDTALSGKSAGSFFTDPDTFADFLTAYYTDYEPESCLVVLDGGVFAGYLLGAKSVRRLGPVFLKRILPRLLLKIVFRGILFRPKNLKFAGALIASLIKGEFRQPDFSREYPATLHLNLAERFRGQGAGSRLLETYFSYLLRSGIQGVHLATFSPRAGEFFTRNGFRLLFQSRRSYLRHVVGAQISCYIYGKKL